MKYKMDSDKMFIFCWEENQGDCKLISLSGLDKEGNAVYDYKYLN